jgi:hypothetical protein
MGLARCTPRGNRARPSRPGHGGGLVSCSSFDEPAPDIMTLIAIFRADPAFGRNDLEHRETMPALGRLLCQSLGVHRIFTREVDVVKYAFANVDGDRND